MRAHAAICPVLLASLGACVSTVTDAQQAEDAEAIAALSRAYGAAFVAGDPEAFARCVTEDFVAMAPGEPAVAGRETARAKVAQDLDVMQAHWTEYPRWFQVRALEFRIEELRICRDWAWARATSRAEVVIRASGEVGRIRGKTLWIFRRGADGVWRIARDASSGDDV